jgi:Aldo/keto reductase family
MREASRADTFIRGVEASLKRLRTDWLDFYFVHAFDVRTPIEQTVRALDDLQQQSKILYPAVSNWAAWQTATALGISAREGLAGFELIRPCTTWSGGRRRWRSFPGRRGEARRHHLQPPRWRLLTGKYGTSAWFRSRPEDALAHLSRSVRCLG